MDVGSGGFGPTAICMTNKPLLPFEKITHCWLKLLYTMGQLITVSVMYQAVNGAK